MESVSEAIARLEATGFVDDFVTDGHMLRAVRSGRRFLPQQLRVVEIVRFEGASDPDDEAIVVALETVSGQPVGTYTVPFGPLVSREDAEALRALRSTRIDD